MNEIDLINEFNELVKGKNKTGIDISYPPTYIVGCPRSGTTALLQFLAETGVFSYPTNCLTRFSSSMEYATIIQELMFNAEFGLVASTRNIDFSSDYGRSNGSLNTNEFFHFYRRFFPNNEIRALESSELGLVDCIELQQQLSVIQKFYKKPFVSKGLMLQYNLDFFYRQLEKPIFLYIKRNPIYVMQSIYTARVKESGSAENWWSAKPKEYSFLKKTGVYSQIAGQVFYTNKAIEDALSSIPEEAKLEVLYEDFVSSPKKVLEKIVEKYAVNKYVLKPNITSQVAGNVKDGNKIKLESSILEKLQEAYDRLANK